MDEMLTISELSPAWVRWLRARNLSAHTLRMYQTGLAQLLAHLGDVPVRSVTPDQLRNFLAELLERVKPATAESRHKALASFFTWLADEGEIPVDIMRRVPAPTVPPAETPILSMEQVRAVLATCGTDFVGRRDRAMLLFLIDTICRAGGLEGLKLDDLDLDGHAARIVEKGEKARIVPMGNSLTVALDRYLRLRRKVPGTSDWLWVTSTGRRFHGIAVRQMVRRRGLKAGIEGLHPHMFRHLGAHRWRQDGGSEADLMALGGWENPASVARYGRSAASQRAREAHKRLGLGDQL